MGIRAGLARQFMLAEETTYGTAVTPTVGFPLVDGEVTVGPGDPIVSDAIYAGRQVVTADQLGTSIERNGGSISGELYAKGGIGRILKHTFGAISAPVGSGPYAYTTNFADPHGLGLTGQWGMPGIGGTVQPITVAGLKVKELEIACEANKNATMACDFVGQSYSTATSLATASVATGRPFRWRDVTWTVAGTAQEVAKWSIKVTNPLNEERDFMGRTTIEEPELNDLRALTAEFSIEWKDFTYFDLFRNGTAAAVVCTLDNGTDTLVFTGNAWFNNNKPEPSGRGQVMSTVPVVFNASTSNDYSALRAVLTNSEAALV